MLCQRTGHCESLEGWCSFCYNHLKLTLFSRLDEKKLRRFGAPNREDDLVGVHIVHCFLRYIL